MDYSFDTRFRPVILVVDDDPSGLNFIQDVLEASEFEVLRARNSVEALLVGSEFFRPIHLLITDIEMKVYRNGLELASCFQVMHPETKVLLINGSESATKRKRYPAINGEWAMISKPFTKSRLLGSISRALAIGSEVPA